MVMMDMLNDLADGIKCIKLDDPRKFNPKDLTGRVSAGLCQTSSIPIGDVKDIASMENNFTNAMNCLAALLETQENFILFRDTYQGPLWELLRYPQLRRGILRVVRQMVIGMLSVTSKSTSAEGVDLSRLVETLQSATRFDYSMKVDMLHILREILQSSNKTKIAFQECGGFVAVMSVLVGLEKCFGESRSEVEMQEAYSVFRSVFEVLVAAISGREEGRNFLVEQITFRSIEDAVLITGILSTQGAGAAFGALFALSLENLEFMSIFNVAESRQAQEEVLLKLTEPHVLLQSPDLLLSILNLLHHVNPEYGELASLVLESLYALSTANRHNLVKMSEMGMLNTLLEWMVGDGRCWFIQTSAETSKLVLDSPRSSVREIASMLAKRLVELGVTDGELRYLFENVKWDKPETQELRLILLEIIQYGLQFGRSPAYIHFDNNVNNRSHMLMSSFGQKPFPPLNGYTFMAWVRFDRFDAILETNVLTILDSEEKVRLYITVGNEASRKFRVSTPKATVWLENFVIEPKTWYHIAITHQKPRLTASHLTFYVNGQFVEEVKCGYIGHPLTATGLRCWIGNPTTEITPFTGTASWDFGPSYFVLEEVMQQNNIMGVYQLGLDYHSNFQGASDRFVTYEMRTNHQDVGESDEKPENKALTRLGRLRQKLGSFGIMEDKLLFVICARNSLDIFRSGTSEFPPNAAHMFGTKFGNTHGIINSAVVRGMFDTEENAPIAHLVGDVLVVCPQRLNDGVWKIGGCSVLLKMIENSTVCSDSCFFNSIGAAANSISKTMKGLEKTICILNEAVLGSWRNQEEMEKNHFYETLVFVLKQKKILINEESVTALLSMCGRPWPTPEYAAPYLSNTKCID